MKKFEVIVPISCLVTVYVTAENYVDAIKTAVGLINEAEESDEIFDELFDFQAHEALFESADGKFPKQVQKAECYG